MKELTQSNFKKEISKGHVALLLYNTFSEPCLEMLELCNSSEKKHKIKFFSVDVDKKPKLGVEFIDVDNDVPTLIFFNKGQEVDRIIGSCSEKPFDDKIESILLITK